MIETFIKKTKDIYNKLLFSNKFYKYIFKHWDKILFPIVKEEILEKEKSTIKVQLNKIANISDRKNPDWIKSAKEIMENKNLEDKNNFHRKAWEFNQIVYCLKSLRYLTPNSSCLSIGAGKESILYYLAHKIKSVIGIDLYEETFYGGEDKKDIVSNIGKYAPFVFPRNKLKLLQMDALNLKFSNNKFDFVFSASSIEHFGKIRDIKTSIEEMYRVLKPGGILVVTTEIKLNRLALNIPGTKVFKLNKLIKMFVERGFKLFDDKVDTRIEEIRVNQPIKLPMEYLVRPHVILRFLTTIFSSVNLVFKKEGNDAFTGQENIIKIQELDYKGKISAKFNKNIYKSDEEIITEIKLTNNSNFDWIVGGESHRIAMRASLLDKNSNIIDEDYSEILIPKNIDINNNITFSKSLIAPKKPGEYIMSFDIKREFITWFSEKGNKKVFINFKIYI